MISLRTNTLKLAGLFLCAQVDLTAFGNGDTAYIKKTVDFTITGSGTNASWDKTPWQSFIKIDSGGRNYSSRSKMLYSEKGIYLLFAGDDELISTKNYNDDEEIYEGDVFEFFLQPDPDHSGYFEYEINQLNKQLVLILSGSPHRNLAWSPWGYEYKKDPLIQKKVAIHRRSETQPNPGSSIKPGDAISSWTAEIFFPFEVWGLLPGVPPVSGKIWRANFCRIDYDSGKMIQWTWSKKIKRSFHELKNFGFIQFE